MSRPRTEVERQHFLKGIVRFCFKQVIDTPEYQAAYAAASVATLGE